VVTSVSYGSSHFIVFCSLFSLLPLRSKCSHQHRVLKSRAVPNVTDQVYTDTKLVNMKTTHRTLSIAAPIKSTSILPVFLILPSHL
jgi:hypothetical protein